MNLLEEVAPNKSGLEQLRILLQSGRRPGMADTLDIRLIEAEEGRVMFKSVPSEQYFNPFGVVHGGFAATMLDFASGYAVISKLASGQSCMTLELKVAYHKAMTNKTGKVYASGQIVTFGRRVAFTEARITDANGTLYASSTSSLLITSI